MFIIFVNIKSASPAVTTLHDRIFWKYCNIGNVPFYLHASCKPKIAPWVHRGGKRRGYHVVLPFKGVLVRKGCINGQVKPISYLSYSVSKCPEFIYRS